MKGLQVSWEGYQQAAALREAAHRAVPPNANTEVTTALAALDAAIDSVRGDTAAARAFSLAGGPAPAATFVDVNVALVSQLKAQDYADQAPTAAMLAGWTKSCDALRTALRTWQRVITRDLAALNAVVARNQLTPVGTPSTSLAAPACLGSVP